MLSKYEIEKICDQEIDLSLNNLSSLIECEYKWQNAETFDYNMFRFSNPLFYNAKHQIETAEKESQKLFINIFKGLLKKSGFEVREVLPSHDVQTSISFVVSSGFCPNTAFSFINDFKDEDWLYLSKSLAFNQLEIVLFYNRFNYKFDKKYLEGGINKTIYKSSELQELFEKYLNDEAYTVFSDKMQSYTIEVKNRIGVIAVDSTSEVKTYNLKKKIRDFISSKDFLQMKYKSIKGSSNEVDDINTICDENKEKINNQFFTQKYYEIMLGESDFANSLLTSEWLYYSYKKMLKKSNEKYDYTPVICGYLKSMEQLIFLFMKCLLNKGYYAQAINKLPKEIEFKERYVKKKCYKDIELTVSNLKYLDTQLGASCVFLKQYNSDNSVLKTSTDEIVSLLNEFRKECRNGYFHTDNVYDWAKVEDIRYNAFLLYYYLIGDCNITLDSFELKLVIPSMYEEFCNSINELFPFMGKRIYMVSGSKEQEIRIEIDDIFPKYCDGSRLYDQIPIVRVDRKNFDDTVYKTEELAPISENCMPDEIYVIDIKSQEKSIIWKKA